MGEEEWTSEEEQKLRRIYPNSNTTIYDISEEFPKRTINAIHRRAQILEVSGPEYRKRERGEPWTDEDLEKLKDLWKSGTTTKKDLINAFPDRSANSIYHKASRLGLEKSMLPEKVTPLLEGNATEFERGFVVGMIEGEGSITLLGNSKGNPSPTIRIYNTDQRLIHRCKKVIGGSVYSENRKGRIQLFELRLMRTKTVLDTLETLDPLFIGDQKKQLSKLVIDYCRSRIERGKHSGITEEEKRIFEEVKEINER